MEALAPRISSGGKFHRIQVFYFWILSLRRNESGGLYPGCFRSSNQCMYDIICGNQGHSLEFNISGAELIQGISHKYCQILHRKDGYDYAF